jgi:flagellar protein FliJ
VTLCAFGLRYQHSTRDALRLSPKGWLTVARFAYRLQKVYDMRLRKKKEQEQVVLEAQAKVRKAEAEVTRIINERHQLQSLLHQAEPMMMQVYDTYIHKLRGDETKAQAAVRRAEKQLEDEEALLRQYHQDLEALEKHKENQKELWKAEQKAIEMKQLDEVAGQRYFRQQAQRAEDDALDNARLNDT